MVFFYLVPVLFSAIGNWLYADYLNLPDLSYPRINLISLHFFILSSVPLILRTFLRVIETSWVFYPPLSLNTPGVGLELTVLSLHLNGISRLIGSMNYFCTFFNTGLANFEVYLFSLLASSILLVLGLPSVIVCLTMVVMDRNLSTHFFNHLEGGNLFMYIHLFWWFGHPEVYVVALPSFGLISSTISVYTHFSNYYESIYSIMMISFIGLSVWAHHMFLDVDWDSRLFYSFMSLLVGLPTGNKVFTWLYSVSSLPSEFLFEAPLFLVLMFSGLFSFGGFTGLVLGRVGLDYFMHDSYYVVAHFHYVISISASIGFYVGLLMTISIVSYLRLATRRNHSLSLLFFFRSNTTFIPIHLLGFFSMPRRYGRYSVALSSYNWLISTSSLYASIIYALSLNSVLIIFIIKIYRC